MEGLVLFNKPPGYTSFQIVKYFKERIKTKIGHGGTLDPFAEGLLLLGISPHFTKKLNKYLKNTTKVYLAEIILGYVSNTYDKEGEITKTEVPLPSQETIKEVLGKYFLGKIKQKPSKFSAVKVQGIPAYKLARQGKDINLREREVIIYDLKLLDFEDNKLTIELKVSSGFYVRSFANDLGEKLKCGAYLNRLIRLRMDNFTLEEALTFDDLKKDYLEFYGKFQGLVQGVGFRYFALRHAKILNILGYAKNLKDGSVEIIAQGREEDLQSFIKELKKGPPLAKIEDWEIIFRKPLKIYSTFEIF